MRMAVERFELSESGGETWAFLQKTRRKSRRLVDDAKALRAQADIQFSRARRNAKRKPD